MWDWPVLPQRQGATPEEVKLLDGQKRHVVGLSGSSERISLEGGY